MNSKEKNLILTTINFKKDDVFQNTYPTGVFNFTYIEKVSNKHAEKFNLIEPLSHLLSEDCYFNSQRREGIKNEIWCWYEY